MGPEAIRLMRAIRERYPDVRVGSEVDPYAAAATSGEGIDPDDPVYRVGVRELLEAGVLSPMETPSLPSGIAGANRPYRVTPEGELQIAARAVT